MRQVYASITLVYGTYGPKLMGKGILYTDNLKEIIGEEWSYEKNTFILALVMGSRHTHGKFHSTHGMKYLGYTTINIMQQ